MTLRMVAGDSPRIWRRAMDRDPTGSAVCTYSAMIAISTSRLRRSRSRSLMRGGLSLQQLHEERVGQQKPLLGEAGTAVLLHEKAALPPRGEARRQVAGLEPDALVEPPHGDAVGEAEPQDEALGHPLAGAQHLVCPHGSGAALDEGAVPLDGLHVGVAHVAEEARRAGAQREVLLRS